MTENNVTRRIPGPCGELAVEDRGRGGTPVLFVHGNGGSSKLWRSQLEHLAPARRALAVDLHGFGLSARTAQAPYSLASFVGDLEAVTRTLGIERVVAVGHSLGSAVIARYGIENRDRVAGVIYVDSVGDTRMPAIEAAAFAAGLRPPSREGPDSAREWFQKLLGGALERTRELVLSELAVASREAVAGAFLALSGVDPSRWIADLDVPALHVFVPEFNSGPRSLRALLPWLPSVPMADVSHWPMVDDPQGFNRHLDRFLATVNGPLRA